MSYNFILSDLHQELNPQQNPDPMDAILESEEFFETEIQELRERLGEVLARHHVIEGQVACYSDFVLRPDIEAYRRAYQEATETYWGSDEEF